jgi:uncharacterized protein (TIGR01777 family)
MRILVSGSTGFLGSTLVAAMERKGHTLVPLTRPESGQRTTTVAPPHIVRWNPVKGEFDAAAAEGFDALVHLAGASIADGRWDDQRKNLLRTSRIDATRQLMAALSKMQHPPRVIVAASAVGYYGNRADETLTEASAPGSGFLADLCQEWETETARGAEFGARVVSLRFGIILSEHGGALPRIVLPFEFGAGGRLGTGKQWMSWLTLAEAVNMIQFTLAKSALVGPVNAVSPSPIQNSEFTRVLAKALHRPALFPAPAFALRLALGEMADALLLSSQRVAPSKLEQNGYKFMRPDLPQALAEIFQH